MHWSGNGYQQVSLGWHSMTTQPSVARFAAFVRRVERPRHYSDTAIGDAIFFSLEHLQSKTDCARHVIDISGDGEENAGLTLAAARKAATDARVTINAIAIEEVPDLHPLTGYFRRWVATPDGFVITANGVADYPRAIRIKLARELAKPTS
jgi:Ca-activated chloride channel family protein